MMSSFRQLSVGSCVSEHRPSVTPATAAAAGQ